MKTLYSAVYADDGFPFNALLDNPENVIAVRDPDEIKDANGALVIWGGADINPDLYGHALHRTTWPGGVRDRIEWSLLTRAKEMGIPIIGVCRGAQMLCAAAGGFLLQDVKNHHGTHFVHTFDGNAFSVNSIHHQMMAGLEKVDHRLLCWTENNRSPVYKWQPVPEVTDGDDIYTPPEGFKEPEFVYFPKINGYAIQWHPEAMSESSDATKYVLNFIREQEAKRGSYSYTALECDC